MAYIEVDVDLDEFSTDELCTELSKRLKTVGRKKLNALQKAKIEEELKELNIALGYTNGFLELKTLDDKMKAEHLNEVWNKYTLSEIQSKLP